MNPSFQKGVGRSNWNCRTLIKKPRFSGPRKFSKWTKAWRKQQENKGKDFSCEILTELKQEHQALKKAGNKVAKKTLVYPYSVMGWTGAKEQLGTRENLISLLPKEQQKSWKLTSRSTREFVAYICQQQKRNGATQFLTHVSIQSENLDESMTEFTDYHQVGLAVRNISFFVFQ
jgi:hypothetical protein